MAIGYPIIVGTPPLLKLTLISAVLTAYQVSGTSYIIATIQGNAQFSLIDGAATEVVSFSRNVITDGAATEVVSFST